jgi:hypothetical protein
VKRFSLVAIGLIVMAAMYATAAPSSTPANVPAFPGVLANARYVYIAMTEISSIRMCFRKIGTRSVLCKTLFGIGAN